MYFFLKSFIRPLSVWCTHEVMIHSYFGEKTIYGTSILIVIICKNTLDKSNRIKYKYIVKILNSGK